MMTPILNAAPGSREEVYTSRHIKARNCVERCFGLLKARWRCLLRHRTLHYAPSKAGKIVIACSILHNMAIKSRLPPMMADIIDVENVEVSISTRDNNPNELAQGRAVLNNLLTRV
jgi:hypothetical protein